MVADPKRPGKTKKVKKVIPPYIPEHDALILAKVRSRAYKMDCGLFTLFGIRFGVPGPSDEGGLLLVWLSCASRPCSAWFSLRKAACSPSSTATRATTRSTSERRTKEL